MRRIYWILILALVSCGDNGTAGPDPDTQEYLVKTDSTNYIAKPVYSPPYQIWMFNVITRFTNPRADTIYLRRCYPNNRLPAYALTQLRGYSPEYEQPFACLDNGAMPLGPGETRVDTLPIIARDPVPTASGFTVQLQLHLELYSCREEVNCRSDVSGSSNLFEVRTQ